MSYLLLGTIGLWTIPNYRFCIDLEEIESLFLGVFFRLDPVYVTLGS